MGKLIGPLCGLVDPGCDAEPLATAGPMIESAPPLMRHNWISRRGESFSTLIVGTSPKWSTRTHLPVGCGASAYTGSRQLRLGSSVDLRRA
jgi:hypothetical protein